MTSYFGTITWVIYQLKFSSYCCAIRLEIRIFLDLKKVKNENTIIRLFCDFFYESMIDSKSPMEYPHFDVCSECEVIHADSGRSVKFS